MTSSLDAGLQYIEEGFAVTPGFSPSMIATPDQIQKIREGNDLTSKVLWYCIIRLCKIALRPHFFLCPLTTKAQVQRWFGRHPDANILIVLGKCSNLVALDIDPSSHHPIMRVADQYKTRKVTTGNGIHCYFRYPKDMEWSRHITMDGMYLKGDHCLMGAPPSVHANGEHYNWLDDRSPIAEFPEALRQSKKAFLSHLRMFELCKFMHTCDSAEAPPEPGVERPVSEPHE